MFNTCINLIRGRTSLAFSSCKASLRSRVFWPPDKVTAVDQTKESLLLTLVVVDMLSSSQLSPFFMLAALSINVMPPCAPALTACSKPNNSMSLSLGSDSDLIGFSSSLRSLWGSSFGSNHRSLLFAEEDEAVCLVVQLREDRKLRSMPVTSGRIVVRQAQTIAMVGST